MPIKINYISNDNTIQLRFCLEVCKTCSFVPADILADKFGSVYASMKNALNTIASLSCPYSLHVNFLGFGFPKSGRKIPRGPQTSAQSCTTSSFRLVSNEIQLLHYQRTFLTLMVNFFRNLQLRAI